MLCHNIDKEPISSAAIRTNGGGLSTAKKHIILVNCTGVKEGVCLITCLDDLNIAFFINLTSFDLKTDSTLLSQEQLHDQIRKARKTLDHKWLD